MNLQTEIIQNFESFYAWQALFHQLGIPAASGFNLLNHRAVYFSVGGFDLDLWGNEDTILSWQVNRSGGDIQYDHE